MSDRAEVTVAIVSYNTRELTLRAIETLLANAGDVSLRVVVWDNASSDGSASAIAAAFPQVECIASPVNLGFGKANNAIGDMAETEWFLLLNSDTETLPGAIQALVAFARAHPEAGVVGGRTLFADGSLNPTAFFGPMTPWSLFSSAVGLSRIFPRSRLFNPELIGGWGSESVRRVSTVTGCLLLMRTELWRKLGGFDTRYFMYAEDTDLCLRAAALGYRPMVTPEAEIVHLGGASGETRGGKLVQLMTGRSTIVRDHWKRPLVPLGLALLWLWAAVRYAAEFGSTSENRPYRHLWRERHKWLAGY